MTYRTGSAGARRRALILGATALTAPWLLSQPAFAQDEQESTRGIDRVVTTAEFRESTVEDTPLAITAVDAQMLEARSQTNIYEVGYQAPNVTLKPAGAAEGGSAMVAFIRGVGQTDFNYAVDPGVGMYVDDVYFPTLTGALVELIDLDRVEILRGPQGTLAGKNSIGGAIKLYTAKPNGDEEGRLSVTYGDFNRAEVRGSADITLVDDKLFLGVAGMGRTVDGYVTRYDYACTHPGSGLPTYVTGNGCVLGKEGGQSVTAGRATLRWTPTPDLEFTLTGDAVNEDSEVRASVLRFADFDVNTRDLFHDNNDNMVYDAGIDVPYDCRFVSYGPNSCDPNSQGKYANYATYSDGPAPYLTEDVDPYAPVSVPPINTHEEWGLSLNADWQLSDNFSLESITSYREYTSEFAEGTDLSPLVVVLLLQRLEHEQFSQEVRFNGTILNDMVDFTLGGFYFDQDGTLEARVFLPYAALDFIHGPDSTPSTNQALFGNVEVHVTDQLNLSGGLRYSEDEKTYTYFRHNPDGTLPPACMGPPGAPGSGANCALNGLNGTVAKFEGDRYDWRVVADYSWTDDILTYAQVSTGYKSGGVNPRPFVIAQAQPVDPEELTSYEVGAKTFFFDRTLRLNAAVFYNDFKDIQLSLSSCPAFSPPVPNFPCVLPANAGDAEVKGWELEAEWQPVDGLIFDASYGSLDFEYTSVDPATGVELSDVPPYTPETTWSAGLQYEFQLGNGWGSLTPRIDVAYQSDTYTEADNDATSLIDDYAIWNGRLTWRSDDNDWAASLEVRNLTDEYYFLTLFDQQSIGYTAAQPGLPRTWAVTLTRNF